MTTSERITAFLDVPDRNEELLADAKEGDGQPSGLDYVAARIVAEAAIKGGQVNRLRAVLERKGNAYKV